MFDYQTIKLLHRHGDADWAPFDGGSDHDVASHDPERKWLRGARIFRCTKCEDEILITTEGESAAEHPFQIG